MADTRARSRSLRPTRTLRRVSRLFATTAVLAGLVGISIAGTATTASADTAPINPAEAPSVSTDSLPTAQMDGVAWAQVVIGDTVYVGGKFAKARPPGAAAGTSEVSRNNILAYNVTTGALLGFSPSFNGVVRALAKSPDGTRLYVGGGFTAVGGVSRNRIAAFDVASGSLVSSFNPNANYFVYSIVANNSTVWLGGNFSAMAGQTRVGAASVAASNGAITSWAPTLSGGKATGLALSPDGSRIVIGGSFTTMNGGSSPGYGLGMVSSTGTGKTNLTFKVNNWVRNAGLNGAITSLSGDSDGVYGSGYDFGSGANFEGTFRASWTDGSIIWLEDCHGDSYSVFATPGLVYKAGHPHYCGNIGGFPQTDPWTVQRGVAYTKQATGTVANNSVGSYYNFQGLPSPTLVQWLPDFNTGTITGAGQGAWSVAGDSRYIVYGGEFTRVNNVAQQGLSRFAVRSIAPNRDGPRLSGSNFVPTVSAGAGSIKVSFTANYDRDNEYLTYRLYRSGTSTPVGEVSAASRWWKRPALSITDTGLTAGQSYSYTVRALDPYGNYVTSQSVSATATAGSGGGGGTTGSTAADDFSRTVSGSWGSAGTGGVWSLYGTPSNFAVTSGVGTMTAPAPATNLQATLTGVKSTASETKTRVTLQQAVTGGSSAYASVIGRAVGGDDYRARLAYSTTGGVILQLLHGGTTLTSAPLSGVTYSPGQTLLVRVRVTGTSPTTIQARAWRDGVTEPSTWLVSTTDASSGLQTAGGSGLAFYIGGSSTGLPRTAVFDDFSTIVAP